jgi:ribosome biogenesis GTPase A
MLEQAARNRGCLLSGGRADIERFATLFLDELRGGRIGRISLERPQADPVAAAPV